MSFVDLFNHGCGSFEIATPVSQYRHRFKCTEPDCEGQEVELVTFEPEPDTFPDCGAWCLDGGKMELVALDHEGDGSAGFSYSPCDICDRPLGGDRYHFALTNCGPGEVYYVEACTDCVIYAANGELPE